MANAILMVTNAGYGETPVPAEALLQPGADMVLNEEDGAGGYIKTAAKVLAVVPEGGCIDYAVADQNGQVRPLCVSDNETGDILYVLDVEGRREFIMHAVLVHALARADAAGLNDGDA